MPCALSPLRCAFGMVALVCAGWAQASVVMTGTRVIYAAHQTEQTLQFHNPDAHPNVVQLWIDDGDRQALPDAAATPFLTLPQVFRVEPQTGQMVRLLVSDASGLPQDRESVFYLNFSQLPVRRKNDANVNQLLLMFTSRVKVFYRPAGIDAQPAQDLGRQLQLAWRDGALRVYNPTACHVVVRQAEWLAGGRTQRLAQNAMIAPFSDVDWHAPDADAVAPQAQLRLVLINDYGADVTVERRLS